MGGYVKKTNDIQEGFDHFSKHVSKIYDILISLTERVDKIEKHLCERCNEEKE